MACVLITTAGLLKLYPLALLPWFIWRSRGRIRIVGTCLALAVAVVLATEPTRWLDFIGHGIPVLTKDALNRTFNYGLPAFVANLACSVRRFVLPDAAVQTWWAVGTCAALLVLIGAYVVCRCGKRNDTIEFALLTVATVAASAKSGHYLVFAIFPMAVGISRAESVGRRLALAVSYVLLNIFATWETPFLNEHLPLKVLANYWPLYGLVVLAWLLASELRRQR